MSRLRYSIVLLALAAAFGVGVPCASAIDPFPNTGIATLTSQHFMVHYNRTDQDPACGNFITQEKAGDILGWAERAYGFYTSWGFAAPNADTDGNGYYDISVDDFTKSGSGCVSYDNPINPSVPLGTDGTYSRWDALISPDSASSGHIHLDAHSGLSFHVVAHELFHLFELKADPTAEQWVQEGSAEWAAFRAESFLTPTEGDLGVNPDRTTDCVGAECGDTEIDKNGYPGWMLFEYLAEQYGQDAVRQVWTQAGSGIAKFAAFLPATRPVDAFYNDFATARLSGNFTLAALKNKLPATSASVTTPDLSGALPTTYVAVNHLAARYVSIHHSSSTNLRAPCYAATLALKVTLPTGVTSTPYYYANTYGAAAQAFTVSGTTATLTVPWNSCASSPDAFISLPNDSWNPGLDGREFQIDGTATVDLNTPASPTNPSGAVVTGPVIATPSQAPAPTLTLYAPEVLRVKATNPILRFVIFSSGEGQLHAVLGGTDLGTSDLRAGNNDVRFALPRSLVAAMRSTSARRMLALQSVAANGDSGDQVITRTVVIQPAAKKKKTVKHH